MIRALLFRLHVHISFTTSRGDAKFRIDRALAGERIRFEVYIRRYGNRNRLPGIHTVNFGSYASRDNGLFSEKRDRAVFFMIVLNMNVRYRVKFLCYADRIHDLARRESDS